MNKQTEKIVKLDLDSLSLLELCANIEMKCAEIYRYFAVYYADVPGMSALWNKTANEEDNHAEQFKLALRLWGTGMKEVKTDQSKINLIIEKLNVFLPRLKESNPTPVQALKFAIQLEENLSEYHMSNLINFTDNELANLFQSMAKNDIGHVKMLHKALKEMTG